MNYSELTKTLQHNIVSHFGDTHPREALNKIVSGQQIDLPEIDKILSLLSECSSIPLNHKSAYDFFAIIIALASYTKIVAHQDFTQTPQDVMRKRIAAIQKDASLSPSEKSKLVMEVISPSSSSMMQKKIVAKVTETSLVYKKLVIADKEYNIPYAITKHSSVPEFLTWFPPKIVVSQKYIGKIEEGHFEDFTINFQEKIETFNSVVEKMKGLLKDFPRFEAFLRIRFAIIGNMDKEITTHEHDEDFEDMTEHDADEDNIEENSDSAEYEEAEEDENEEVDASFEAQLSYEISRENGCPHYVRNNEMKCPTCDKYYVCRLCHDAAEDHEMDRKKVTTMRCLNCETEQAWTDNCIGCGVLFGTYNCHICHYCDNFPGKQLFHCDKCGICRVGDGTKYKHCDKCNACWHIDGFEGHRCFIGGKKALCAACGEATFDSRYQSLALPCGHVLHHNCYISLFESGKYSCPLCRKLILEGPSKEQWEKSMAAWVEANPVPREFADQERNVSCNECGTKFHTKISITAYKCPNCNTYNTQEA